MKFQAALSALLFAFSSSTVKSETTETGIFTETKSAMEMAEFLIADVPYLTITGASVTGKAGCAGVFSGGNKAVPTGFPDTGVVISTGFPASLHLQTSDRLSTIHGEPGDADLDAIVVGETMDACVLEFSFKCDYDPCPIMFEYVFGSEEYTEYVNNNVSPDSLAFNYNDVFAWFLNGENIATIPETGEPVSIDTVNDEFNTKYFINNDPSISYPVPFPNMEADGFTTMMKAYGQANGEGASNTMKLVIADRGDMQMDSWGLFKSKSFVYTPPAGGAGGDPHFQRWGVAGRDTFHGECDLVLLHAEEYHGGLDVHVRTTMESYFSYIESAAVRVGDNLVEVHNGGVMVNGAAYKDADLPITFGDNYQLSLKETEKKNGKIRRRKYALSLEDDVELEFRFYKKMMTFNMVGHPHFQDANGMLGHYPTGKMLARDGSVMTNFMDFGFEWQVNPAAGDATIFSNLRAPQMPYETCRIPTMAMPSRRQLRGADMKLLEQAQEACATLPSANIKLCVDDVMMTGDIELAHEW